MRIGFWTLVIEDWKLDSKSNNLISKVMYLSNKLNCLSAFNGTVENYVKISLDQLLIDIHFIQDYLLYSPLISISSRYSSLDWTRTPIVRFLSWLRVLCGVDYVRFEAQFMINYWKNKPSPYRFDDVFK